MQSSISDLIDLLTQRALEHPTHGYSFFTDGEAEPARMTYAELDRRARAIAAGLVEKGASGEPVLILCPPGLDYIAAFFGCLYAGSIATPAYPPDPMRLKRTLPRLRAIVADTGARFVLTTSPFVAMGAMVAGEAPELSTLEWIAVDVESGAESRWSRPTLRADRLAFLQYTSGSTSTPKGVMVSHQNLLHNLGMISAAMELSSGSKLAFWLPPYHDMGLIGGILTPLFAGGEGVLMSPLDFLRRPMFWLEVISKTRADLTGAPNFAFDLCVRKSTEEERRKLDLSCLTLAFNAAEPTRAETMDAFQAAFAPAGFVRSSLYTCFGLAEGTLLATGTKRFVEPAMRAFSGGELERGRSVPCSPDEPGARRLVALGKSPEKGALVIVDPKTRRVLGEGEVGELWLKSGSVALGYWKNADATWETFGALLADGSGPYLRTGDLGFVFQGELYFVTRIKDIVIIRGKNHYPHDIERAIERAHPALRPGCGVAFGIERGGEERLAIAWEVEPSKMRDPSEVVARIKAAAADQEGVVVDTVLLLEAKSLPKTSSGKLQRRQTKAEYLEGTLALVHEHRAETAVSVAAAELGAVDLESIKDFLIARIALGAGLHEDAVDPELPFQEFGFDSHMVVQLTADLSARTGRNLPATLAFNYPTINALSRHLAYASA